MDALDWQLQGTYEWISYKSFWAGVVGSVIAMFLGVWMFGVKNYDLRKETQWEGKIVEKQTRKNWYDFFRGYSNRSTRFFWKVKLKGGETRWIYAESGRMYHLSKEGDPVEKRKGETTPRLMSEEGKKRRKNLQDAGF